MIEKWHPVFFIFSAVWQYGHCQSSPTRCTYFKPLVFNTFHLTLHPGEEILHATDVDRVHSKFYCKQSVIFVAQHLTYLSTDNNDCKIRFRTCGKGFLVVVGIKMFHVFSFTVKCCLCHTWKISAKLYSERKHWTVITQLFVHLQWWTNVISVWFYQNIVFHRST